MQFKRMHDLNIHVIPGMLMIGANAGIVGMTKEHLGLALALSVPVFVVVTKIDMCPPNVLQENLKLLIRILKSPGCRKVPVTVKTPDDVVISATNFVSERLVRYIIRILHKKKKISHNKIFIKCYNIYFKQVMSNISSI